ncbi:unnamed protein product [Owenia fusiformis]|uniref:Protein-lysine N-methyltransferase OFUS_LOCUS10363 n=1 Tax=Owenia fusiformis TaxID=6347 RepID=A0A8J1XGK7_OWEFU|nr:unnamed protein product [Owenia fusiformis]
MSAPMSGNENCENELDSSKLGTKPFWDDAYKEEIQNFKINGDVGEVWFGEDTMERVVDWINENDSVTKSSSILDIGTGNGVMLLELHALGYESLTGVDYSDGAVELAKSIAASKDAYIKFETADILADLTCTECLALRQTYDVCVDKGTYDAISLNPNNVTECRQKYIENVWKILNENGLLVITSCNWTKEELLNHFSKGFKFQHHIRAPTFQFGGKTGSTVTSLIFQKSQM